MVFPLDSISPYHKSSAFSQSFNSQFTNLLEVIGEFMEVLIVGQESMCLGPCLFRGYS